MLIFILNVLDTESDRERFIKIYEKYKKLMHLVAVRILNDNFLAEDAVHEAFINAAKNFDKIRELDDEHIKNLMAIMARNEAVSVLRKGQKYRETDSIDKDVFKFSEPVSANDVFNTVSYSLLKDEILKLPEKYRNLLYLLYVGDLDLKTAAGILHISYETAKKRLQRARKILLKNIEG